MSVTGKSEVAELFSSIAGKYDLMNDIITFGFHRVWKSRLVNYLTRFSKKSDKIIDIASGTGDIALVLLKDDDNRKVTATDFCDDMLEVLRKRKIGSRLNLTISIADAMELNFDDDSFDGATIGYGIRNVPDPAKCLTEMARVVSPGGAVAILETGQPKGFFRIFWKFQTKVVIPFLGWLLASNVKAYTYLPSTAASFPSGYDFEELMNGTDCFKEIHSYPQMFGVSYIYIGVVR